MKYKIIKVVLEQEYIIDINEDGTTLDGKNVDFIINENNKLKESIKIAKEYLNLIKQNSKEIYDEEYSIVVSLGDDEVENLASTALQKIKEVLEQN